MFNQPLSVIRQPFETVVPCIWKVSCSFLFFVRHCKFPLAIEMVNWTSLCALSHLVYTAVGHLGFWNHLGKGLPYAMGTKYSQDPRECDILHRDSVPADACSLQLSLVKFLLISCLSKMSVTSKLECSLQLLLRELPTALPGVHNHSEGRCLELGLLQDCSAPYASTLCQWGAELQRQW